MMNYILTMPLLWVSHFTFAMGVTAILAFYMFSVIEPETKGRKFHLHVAIICFILSMLGVIKIYTMNPIG